MKTDSPNADSTVSDTDGFRSAPRDSEQRSLLVNDIRVLCSQLNEAMYKAADEEGMRIEIGIAEQHRLVGPIISYPVVSVRILAEVH